MEKIEAYTALAVQGVALLLTVVGILAFLVGATIQVIKGLPGIRKVPTDVVVVALALLASFCAMGVLCIITALPVAWYHIAAAIVVGILVAFISMFGWSKLHELWERNKKQ